MSIKGAYRIFTAVENVEGREYHIALWGGSGKAMKILLPPLPPPQAISNDRCLKSRKRQNTKLKIYHISHIRSAERFRPHRMFVSYHDRNFRDQDQSGSVPKSRWDSVCALSMSSRYTNAVIHFALRQFQENTTVCASLWGSFSFCYQKHASGTVECFA